MSILTKTISKTISVIILMVFFTNIITAVSADAFSSASYMIMSFDIAEKDDHIMEAVEKQMPDFFIIHSVNNQRISLSPAICNNYSQVNDNDFDKESNQNIIFYKNSYTSLKSKTIWLSGTPDKKSKCDNAKDYQTCTYALFYNVNTNEKIAIFAAQTERNDNTAKIQAMYLFSKFQCYRDYYPTVLSVKCDNINHTKIFDDQGLSSLIHCKDNINVYASTSVKKLSETDSGIKFTTSKPSKQLINNGKYIALTFDDGPTRLEGRTNKILSSIEKHNIKATFFVLGSRINDENPIEKKLLLKARSLGCEIGNHTYNHDSYAKLKDIRNIKSQITQTDLLIEEICGASYATLLRPPGGIVNNKSDLDRPIINWSVDTLDWSSKQTVKGIINTVKRDSGNGKIILMHDINTKSSAAIDDIINYLLSNNYNLVTVSELMEFCDVDMWAGYIYTDANHEKRTTFCN